MKYSELLHITLGDYIRYYFGDKKPKQWEEINTQMAELMGSSEQDFFLNLYKKYLELNIRKTLYLIGNGKEDKRLQMEIKIVEADLKALEQTSESSEKMSMEKFSIWIMQVSKWLGFQIKKDEVTLFDFLIATNEMKKEIEQKSKAYKHAR